MFEICLQFLIQLIGLIPGLIGIYLIFDFLGSFLFGNK